MQFEIGTDLVSLDRIKTLWIKQKRLPERILTLNELKIFRQLSSIKQLDYLAGRFASKEAFSKAYGTGIGPHLSFQSIEILNDHKGKPYISNSPFQGTQKITIAHEKTHAIAFVMLIK